MDKHPLKASVLVPTFKSCPHISKSQTLPWCPQERCACKGHCLHHQDVCYGYGYNLYGQVWWERRSVCLSIVAGAWGWLAVGPFHPMWIGTLEGSLLHPMRQISRKTQWEYRLHISRTSGRFLYPRRKVIFLETIRCQENCLPIF